MKHLKKFEMDFYSGKGSGSVPEKPTGQNMTDKLQPQGSSGEAGKPNLTKAEVLAMIQEILNNSPKFGEEEGLFFASTVTSKKGRYLEILEIVKDKKERSTGIYISEIDPETYSPPKEPYEGI